MQEFFYTEAYKNKSKKKKNSERSRYDTMLRNDTSVICAVIMLITKDYRSRSMYFLSPYIAIQVRSAPLLLISCICHYDIV